MVRMLAGAVAAVGMGKLTIPELVAIRGGGPRPPTLRIAPAEGLYLMRIAYAEVEAEEILSARPRPGIEVGRDGRRE
jgi:tRNA U38,U39,U40 pseudouridine synthase TruA